MYSKGISGIGLSPKRLGTQVVSNLKPGVYAGEHLMPTLNL